jgi:hypothetical protein
MDCGIPLERGRYKGSLMRCNPCREKFKVKYAKEYEEIIVLKTCLECNELMIIERKEGEHLGKYRNYCPTCRPKHYGRRKFGYVSQLIRTCPECKKEMTYHHLRPYKGISYCVKCIKRIKKREIHENSLRKKEEYQKRLEETRLERQSRRCIDCNKELEGIPIRNWNTIRCKPCQKTYHNATLKTRINKAIGSSTNKQSHMVKDITGKPDWNKEMEEVKKLKRRTYHPYKGDYKNKQTEEDLKKIRVAEGEDG